MNTLEDNKVKILAGKKIFGLFGLLIVFLGILVACERPETDELEPTNYINNEQDDEEYELIDIDALRESRPGADIQIIEINPEDGNLTEIDGEDGDDRPIFRFTEENDE